MREPPEERDQQNLGQNSDTHQAFPGAAANDNAATTLSPLVPIEQLPPLRTPRHRSKRRQSLFGIGMVVGITGLLVGLTHGIALSPSTGFDTRSVPWWIFLILIYGQAGMALLCLVAILIVNPGFVPRTPETCYPIPTSVAAWLTSKNDDDRPIEYYLPSLDEHSRDTYCTRCLVWRRSKSASGKRIKYFHCNICQRCVSHFDHHCDFFGRCIAGPHSIASCSYSGNLRFFWGIIVIGGFAYLTCLGAILGGLIFRFDPFPLVVPFFLAGVFLLHVFSPCFQQMVLLFRRSICFFC